MPADTTPDAARVRAELYRRMSPAERCELAARMSAEARQVTLAGIRHRHPEYDERQVQLALFRLLLGDDLFRRAYRDAPFLAP